MSLFTDNQVGTGYCDKCITRVFADEDYKIIDELLFCEDCLNEEEVNSQMKRLVILSLSLIILLIGCTQSQANSGLKEYRMIGVSVSNETTLCKGCGISNIIVLYNDNGNLKRVDSYYPIKVEGNILKSEYNIVGVENGEVKYIKGKEGELVEGEVIGFGSIGRYGDRFGIIATVDGKAQVYNTYDLYLNKDLNKLLGSIVQIGTENNVIKIN